MNIAIFGANGATGRLLTQYALSAEHQVTVLTRELSPLRIAASLSGGPLKIVRGSVFDLAPVLETLQGVDAVFSALGAHSPFPQ